MSPNPSTIILALWRDATSAAAEELKISYATKYPRAKIFLLRGGGGEEEKKQQQQQQQLLLLADKNQNDNDNNNNNDDDHLLLSPTKSSILIHISDHHAATQICQFLREHLSRTGNVLDVGTVIFDHKNIPQPSQPSTSLRRWWILPFSLLWCWWSSNFISFLAIWISRRIVGGGDESLYCRWTWIRHDFVDGGILPGDVRLEFLGRKSMMKKKERNGDGDDDDDVCEEELLIGGGVWFSDWRG